MSWGEAGTTLRPVGEPRLSETPRRPIYLRVIYGLVGQFPAVDTEF